MFVGHVGFEALDAAMSPSVRFDTNFGAFHVQEPLPVPREGEIRRLFLPHTHFLLSICCKSRSMEGATQLPSSFLPPPARSSSTPPTSSWCRGPSRCRARPWQHTGAEIAGLSHPFRCLRQSRTAAPVVTSAQLHRQTVACVVSLICTVGQLITRRGCSTSSITLLHLDGLLTSHFCLK
jgi:hypothetical protein